MGSYITINTIVKAISPTTVLALCDDNNIGEIDAPEVIDIVESVIERAEAQVNSFLARAYPALVFPVVQTPNSVMLKQASLMFAIPYMYMRHPEYVRTFGDDPRGGSDALKNAIEFMERVCTGMQFLFDVPASPKPSVVGGVFISSGPRTIIDGPGDQRNSGDF